MSWSPSGRRSRAGLTVTRAGIPAVATAARADGWTLTIDRLDLDSRQMPGTGVRRDAAVRNEARDTRSATPMSTIVKSVFNIAVSGFPAARSVIGGAARPLDV